MNLEINIGDIAIFKDNHLLLVSKEEEKKFISNGNICINMRCRRFKIQQGISLLRQNSTK